MSSRSAPQAIANRWASANWRARCGFGARPGAHFTVSHQPYQTGGRRPTGVQGVVSGSHMRPRHARIWRGRRYSRRTPAQERARHEARRPRRHRCPHARGGVVPAAGRCVLAALRGRGEQVFQGRQAADHRGDGRLLPRAPDRARDVHRRQRAQHRLAPHPEYGGRRGGRRQPRHDDRVRLDRSAQGADGRAGGTRADRGRRDQGLQVPPDRAGLLPQRSAWPTSSTR